MTFVYPKSAAHVRGRWWKMSVAVLAVAGLGVISGWSATHGSRVAAQEVEVGDAATFEVAEPLAVVDPPETQAAVDYFLKLDGIEGESTAPGQGGAIEILSWSWGATNSGSHASGGGGGAGKVQMQDFHFTMKVSKASPKLFLRCATGEHIKKATLTVRKAGGRQEDYLVVTLEDVLISSYQSSGSPDSPIPTDEVSLSFSKITYSVGGVKAHYDVKSNKGN